MHVTSFVLMSLFTKKCKKKADYTDCCCYSSDKKSSATNILHKTLRRFAKLNKFQKTELTLEVGGWDHVSLGKIIIGNLSQNSPTLALIFGVVYHVYF